MKSSTTSGIHRLKLGQLMTLDNHVYQCVKYKGNFVACEKCVIAAHDNNEFWAESYITCKRCHENGYFKQIK